MKQTYPPIAVSVREFLEQFYPDYRTFTLERIAAGYSNEVYLITVEMTIPDSTPKRLVLKRYAQANGECAEKARREFHGLSALHPHVPVPTPLYLDDRGKLFASPSIVTGYLPGRQIPAHPESLAWVEKVPVVAETLAQIHATPYDNTLKPFLLDANQQALWFLHNGVIPLFMEAHFLGVTVWQAIDALYPRLQPVKPTLVHIDYWSGNILWDNNQISAVLDWEEIGYGDAAIDVAYCRMELYLEGMNTAANEFLQLYEAKRGQKLANLPFWELAAAARPMVSPPDWFTLPIMEERFHQFIAQALKKCGY